MYVIQCILKKSIKDVELTFSTAPLLNWHTAFSARIIGGNFGLYIASGTQYQNYPRYIYDPYGQDRNGGIFKGEGIK